MSERARDRLQDPSSDVILSVVSVWEMQIKHQLGKLDLRKPLGVIIEDQRRLNKVSILPVELNHVLALDVLPTVHNDPFDRLLVAQARAIEAVLVSKDATVGQYPIRTLW